METGLPLTWSDSQNLQWKADLPGLGTSSPIVFGDRVFVTCYSGYGTDAENPGEQEKLLRHLLCLNLQDGTVRWQKDIAAVLPEDPYRGFIAEHGYASSTPATDGERVYVFFGKSGVLAFDFDGNQLWQQSVGTGSAIMGWGSASSPVLYKDFVIINANAEGQALVALDKVTGREVWKADAEGYAGSWSTPVLVEGSKPQLVVHLPGEVWAFDPEDGGLIWYCTDVPGAATTSLVAHEEVVYVVGGGPGGGGAMAIRAGGKDDVTTSHTVWKKQVGSYVPSPTIVGDKMYWVDDRGTAVCVDTKSGEPVYRERLEGASGAYSSLVAAEGRLYAVTRRNGTFVLPATGEFKVLAHNVLESDSTDFNASPAISQGRILLRSNRSLYCLGMKP
jgi:outer membrane protein assembly factor BamB